MSVFSLSGMILIASFSNSRTSHLTPSLTLIYKENIVRTIEYQENYCILNKITAFQYLMQKFYLSQISHYTPNLFLKFHIGICTFKLSFKMRYL